MEGSFLTDVSVRSYTSGDKVFAEGDHSDENMYFILEGELAVFKGDGPARKLINQMHAHEFFGELALLTEEPRTATVVVTSPTARLAFFGKRSFIEETSKNTKFAYALFKASVERQNRAIRALGYLKVTPNAELAQENSELIDTLREANQGIAEFVNSAHHIVAGSGQAVFERGAPTDGNIYFVLSGNIELSMPIAGNDCIIDTVAPGESFGWGALVSKGERPYTATATNGDARLLFIDRELFLKSIPLAPELFFHIFSLFARKLVLVERLVHAAQSRS